MLVLTSSRVKLSQPGGVCFLVSYWQGLSLHNLRNAYKSNDDMNNECPPSSYHHRHIRYLRAWGHYLNPYWFITNIAIDKNLILGCLWPLVFVLNNILILNIWCSTIPHLPGCFCPWTFFENIGFNTELTDPFMSHLATQLGYSAGEFQALQLIVLAAFGVVD